ncbi:MAG: L,D-transpeptidase [Thermodesulfovibrio sp.]|nr:L,D-transpeptidase [Thermodesulfovibrio sp.]
MPSILKPGIFSWSLAVYLGFFVLAAGFAEGAEYSYTAKNAVIGNIEEHTVVNDESLYEIARHFNLGFTEIARANPKLDPFAPGNGAAVTIPTFWVLPNVAAYRGIVINLPEMRLYFFHKDARGKKVTTYPVGIGRDSVETPLGLFRITEKIRNPSWHVPNSIRKEKSTLPPVVPPGPDNPLGSHALRLSSNAIMLHGTNKPWGVGQQASHGCLRLYPEDIPELYNLVPVGTSVKIISQPIKIGVIEQKIFIEVHLADTNTDRRLYMNDVFSQLRQRNLPGTANKEKILKALQDNTGIPTEISDDIPSQPAIESAIESATESVIKSAIPVR